MLKFKILENFAIVNSMSAQFGLVVATNLGSVLSREGSIINGLWYWWVGILKWGYVYVMMGDKVSHQSLI